MVACRVLISCCASRSRTHRGTRPASATATVSPRPKIRVKQRRRSPHKPKPRGLTLMPRQVVPTPLQNPIARIMSQPFRVPTSVLEQRRPESLTQLVDGLSPSDLRVRAWLRGPLSQNPDVVWGHAANDTHKEEAFRPAPSLNLRKAGMGRAGSAQR